MAEEETQTPVQPAPPPSPTDGQVALNVSDLQSTVDKWTSLYAATDEKHDKSQENVLGDKLISANGKDCSSLSHAELIAFLRKIGNDSNVSTDNTNSEEVELRLYRDASGSQTPTSPSTEMHSKQSENPFPSPRHSNNKMATMSHPNLPSFLSSSNSNSGGSSSSKNHKRLRQEAKEMVIVEIYVFLPRE